MQADEPTKPGWTARRVAGHVIGTLAGLFLLVDGAMKLPKPEFVVKGTVELGYPENAIVGMGIVLMASSVLYLIPRTSVLGAILLTAYLGGAVATHVRVEHDWFSTLFPVVFAALLWGGLCLRDPRLPRLIFRRT